METYKFYFTDRITNITKDLEPDFGCKYVSFTNLSETGEVKNIITEDYVESDGARMYIPENTTVKTTECVLSVLFDEENCLPKSRAFADFVLGREIDYFDTFRKLYLRIVCTKMALDKELLYGENPYRLVKYTFTNVLGRSFTHPI